MKDFMLKKHYGISLDRYNQMLTNQGGKCAICPATISEAGRKLSVDHDHSTGQIRGLLCNRCNHLLGLAKDSSQLLADAITYLSKVK